MSTELVESTFYATAFWGGKERGQCCQITDETGHYVQLTVEEMNELIGAWQAYIGSKSKKENENV